MKKIKTLFFTFITLTTFAFGCGKNSQVLLPTGAMPVPQLITVNPDQRTAVVNFQGQALTLTIVTGPTYDMYGNMTPGNIGTGIIVTPPVAPSGWSQDQYGRWVPNPATFTPGMTAETGTVYIVQGRQIPGTNQLGFTVVSVIARWSNAINPQSWMSLYPIGATTMPPGWYQPVQVALTSAGYTALL